MKRRKFLQGSVAGGMALGAAPAVGMPAAAQPGHSAQIGFAVSEADVEDGPPRLSTRSRYEPRCLFQRILATPSKKLASPL